MSQLHALTIGQRLRRERLAKNWSQARLAEELDTSEMTIRRWEHNVVFPQARFRALLCQLFGRSNEELFGSVTPTSDIDQEERAPFQPLLWTVPYLRNPYFTGREDMVALIHAKLTPVQASLAVHAVALTGLGGIGKSQLAIEYAYRYASTYSAIFWLAAETMETLMASLQTIANLLALPEGQASEQSQMVIGVQRWLTTHQGWLLIADNVEEPGLLQSVLPPIHQGTLLLTTRGRTPGAMVELLDVLPLDDTEGACLLLRRARKLLTPFPDTSLSTMLAESMDIQDAIKLTRVLEGLPLALDQAGSYIEETGCSVADYRKRYASHRQHLLARRGNDATHRESVTTTLQFSIQWIARKHAGAIDMLRLCACFYAEAIPEELLSEGATRLHPVLDPGLADLYQFDLLMAALRNASLVTRYPDARTLSIHRLVQVVILDQMDASMVHVWYEHAVRIIHAFFPEPEYMNWSICERYLAQALHCLAWFEQLDDGIPEVISLMTKTGRYLMARGRLPEAEKIFDQSVVSGLRLYGVHHETLIPVLIAQSELLWSQGKYEQTEQVLQQAQSLAEQHLEPDHLTFADIYDHLGTLCWKQGKYEQAETLHQQAIVIREQRQGPDHLETAETINNLALLYWEQKKYKQAEGLNYRSLAIREQQLPSDHPVIAVSLNNLANLQCDQGNYTEAENLYKRSLAIREQYLGPEHPKTAVVLTNIGTLYRDQHKYEQAEAAYLRTLAIQEQKLGVQHPDLVVVLHHLALLYDQQGRFEQAETCYQRALKIGEDGLGSTHVKVVKISADYQRFLAGR